MKKLTLSVATLLIAGMSYGQTQCTSKTEDNVQCKNITKKTNKLCHNHDKNHKVKSDIKTVLCTGITKKNIKCKNRVKHKSGLCHNHRKTK